jgi:hypothetical protein
MTSVRTLLLAVPVGLALVIGGAGTASATTANDLLFGADSDFCGGVQAVTASMSEGQIDNAGGITTVTYTDETAFVLSKSISEPLTTRAYTVEGETGDTIYCKGRSTDGLVYDLGAGAAGNEKACSAVLERQRAVLWAMMTEEERAAAPYQLADVVVMPDDEQFIGPLWAIFDPVFPTVTVDGDVVRLQARSLYASINDPSGLPIEWKGNKYCTLPTNDHLRSVLGWNGTGPVPPNPTEEATPTASPTAPAPTAPAPSAPAPTDETPQAKPEAVEDGADTAAKPAADGAQATAPVLAATGGPTNELLPAAAILMTIGGLVLVATRRRQARMTDG